MRRTLLWLVAFLAYVSASPVDGAPLNVMSAPNLLRVGTSENIFVECQDCTGEDIGVTINVLNHPTKNIKLASRSVTLTSAAEFQALAQIMIPVRHFSRDPSRKQYVYLQAQFPDQLLERVVLVSFQSGYIFIQTDKTLYTPDSNVHYRVFAVTPHMKPVEQNEEAQNDVSIAIEFVTPEGIIFPRDIISLQSGVYSRSYRLGELISPGLWKVVAKFQSNPQQRFAAEFEVKEYVLPSFEVKLAPSSPFFYVDSQELNVNIKATYVFGEEVEGTAYVIFGVMHDGSKKHFPRSLQQVQINGGSGDATLRREHVTQTFPNIIELVGSSIFVAVTVLTESGAEMVEAELRGIQIVTSPYKISFKKTPKYFKPGMSFDVTVDVLNPDDTPAQGVAVVVEPGHMTAVTSPDGLVRVPINTVGGADRLVITARTNDPLISIERQASAFMTVHPSLSPSNSYIHIGVHSPEVELGDSLNFLFFFNRLENAQRDVTYLIVSRGQLVTYGRFQIKSQTMFALTLPVTKEMMPSFRIVAYYHTDNNEVVSDSAWVDVKDSCVGSLKLEASRPGHSYEPRSRFLLKVTGPPEAKVELAAVNKGVIDKIHLTQKRIWDIVETFDTGCTAGEGKDSMGVFYDAGLLFGSNASGTLYRKDVKCEAPKRRKRATTDLGDEDDGYFLDSHEIISRPTFYQSWLWRHITLPPCPKHKPNCDTTSHLHTLLFPSSITTWQITGISLSRSHGICVADPLEVVVQKKFFINLRLPYSAVKGEQLEIKAVLHNQSPDDITVLVEMTEKEHVCSAAFKRGKLQQEVKVGPQTTKSVPFIIIPLKEGSYPIEVKAAVKNSSLNDGIMKMLQVVPRGVLTKSVNIITLDPAKRGVDGTHMEIINSNVPKGDIIKNTPTTTMIHLTVHTGQEFLVEKAVSGNSMDTLIIQPSGNGAENMIRMTLPVITTLYLDKTNQWDTVGFEKRNEALQHILAGYQNELVYRKADGSFAELPSIQSSTWLTAYVVKVFTMANDLVTVRRSYICDAVKYLILNSQRPDGRFLETGTLSHGEMMGDVRGTDSDASMTAFVLIALQESHTLCVAAVNALPASINKAVSYLESRLPNLANPSAVAMASYALANENKLDQKLLYKFASAELSHWPTHKGPVYTLEATAYALLALVKAKAFREATPVVKWFNQQSKVGGGYGSTQATVMVYQAVAEYSVNEVKELKDYHLEVDLWLPGRSRPERHLFNRENYHETRTTKINTINEDVRVVARGTGEATLKMVSLYYTLPREKESDCQKFNVSVQLIPVKTDDDEKIYTMKIMILYMDSKRDATMSILDVGLLSGFTVNTKDLDLQSSGRARTISKYEMNTFLSENGSVTIYLDKVSRTQPEEVTFRIHQQLKVGILKPAAVSVYEYYDLTPCVKFYHPENIDGRRLALCRNTECVCTGEHCSRQRKEAISNDERIRKICETTETGKIDFAYRMTVKSIAHGLSTDVYTAQIEEIIKEGSYDVSALGRLRPFLAHTHCREALDLKIGKSYLIMGSSKDIHKEDQFYQYVLDEKTWIEYWPTEDECKTEEHRPLCISMKELVLTFILFGCLN